MLVVKIVRRAPPRGARIAKAVHGLLNRYAPVVRGEFGKISETGGQGRLVMFNVI